MELVTAQQILNDNGFPAGPADGIYGARTRAALQHFQNATTHPLWNAGGYDDATINALNQLPQLSTNFTVNEVRSTGNGNCYIRSELLNALEDLRLILNRPIPIASGYRDAKRNALLPGSATNSLHLYGLAADITSLAVHVTLNEVRNMGIFSGIGWVRTSGFVRHIDLRHLTGRHTQTPWNPSIWSYRK